MNGRINFTWGLLKTHFKGLIATSMHEGLFSFMANDPAFLFYPGDYLRDTQCLSEKAQVAYDRIMCEHMRNICISQEQLNFFTKRLNSDEKQELLMVLAPVKGGFHIPWVTESITKRREYSESRRKNRVGTDKTKPKKISKSYDSHMENEIEIVNKDVNVIKGVQGDFSDEWFKSIFDDIMIESFKSTFRERDVDNELKVFMLKVRGSPGKYSHRDTDGIRQAFLYQLQHSTSKKNGHRDNTKTGIRSNISKNGDGKTFGTWE